MEKPLKSKTLTSKDKDVKLITDPEADVAGVAAVHNDVPETDEEEAAVE